MTTLSLRRPLEIRSGIFIAEGYGIRTWVNRGHLCVQHGMENARRTVRLSRATSGLRRLILLGRTGFVTLDALRWLHDRKAALVHLDPDGQVITASGPLGLREARLRRAQALAAQDPSGLQVARELLREKLIGEREILQDLNSASHPIVALRDSLERLDRATSLKELTVVEAQAAAAYWSAWAEMPLTFARSDLRKLPDHWLRFGQRTSPLSGSPRLAANPANAILNYLYAILEAEARIACLAVGLDPGLGIVHADQGARDSLALDLMEAARPRVDGYVLNLLRSKIFRASDFFETRQGVCRVVSPLTHHLALLHPVCARWVAPVAERVTQALTTAPGARTRRMPTPLTQTNRSAGRGPVRRRQKRRALESLVKLPHACRICGTLLPDADTLYCDDCHRDRRRELVAHYTTAGLEALADLRSKGADPAHGKEAALKRGARNAQHVREAVRWNRAHGGESSPADFVRNILPRLKAIPLSAISKATGLSRGYASMIRRGLYVPHPRHWDSLKHIKASGHEHSR